MFGSLSHTVSQSLCLIHLLSLTNTHTQLLNPPPPTNTHEHTHTHIWTHTHTHTHTNTCKYQPTHCPQHFPPFYYILHQCPPPPPTFTPLTPSLPYPWHSARPRWGRCVWIGRWSHRVAMEAEAVTSLTTTSGWGAHHGLLLRHEHVHVHADRGRWVVIFCGRAPSGVACCHLLIHKHAEEGLKVTAHYNMRTSTQKRWLASRASSPVLKTNLLFQWTVWLPN